MLILSLTSFARGIYTAHLGQYLGSLTVHAIRQGVVSYLRGAVLAKLEANQTVQNYDASKKYFHHFIYPLMNADKQVKELLLMLIRILYVLLRYSNSSWKS